MPEHTNPLAIRVELTLVFLGLGLLWPLVFSPTARARHRPAALGPWAGPLIDFLLFLWLTFCGGLVAQFGASATFKLLTLDQTQKMIFGTAAFDLGELAGIALFYRGFSRRLPAPSSVSPTNVLVSGVVTFLAAMPVVFAVGLVWQLLLKACGLPAEPQDILDQFLRAKSHALLVSMIVVASVIAPIAEELIFRAGIFRYARTRLPRWAALFAPACLFGAMHANLASFAQLVALGIVFSLAYERTGRIGTAIVAHALFNLHTIVLLLVGATV
jgi:membrane protease YdiL (CAAX protease family)